MYTVVQTEYGWAVLNGVGRIIWMSNTLDWTASVIDATARRLHRKRTLGA